jgi:predicted methyltransferase
MGAPLLLGARGPRRRDEEDAPRAVVDPVRDSVLHSDRPAGDRARDADRRPRRVLDFFDVKPGMHVADLMAGDGYYTEMLSRVVGPTGRVYCQNTKIPLEVFAEKPLTARLSGGRLPNVERLDREFDDVGIPPGVDAALLVRFYHDFGWQQVDREGFNWLVFHLVKPGGVFGVVDHVAADGAGMDVGQSLHRVEPTLVRREIEAAGFRLEAESWALSNPDDAHDWNIFRGGGRGRDRTDRFVYLFRRPEE